MRCSFWRTVLAHVEANGTDPLFNQAGVLAGAQVAHIVDAAREDEIVERAAATVEPGQQCFACFGHQLKLNGSVGFLLDDRRPVPDGMTVMMSPIFILTMSQPRSLLSIARSNSARSRNRRCPSRKKRIATHVAWLQRALRADHIASVPRPALASAGIEV